MKKEVYKFLDKNPKATTPELRKAFPKGHKKTLWNYWGQWKKERGIMPKEKNESIRQKVFQYFDKNPDASPKDVRKAFPDANTVSIANYRYQWKKLQPKNSKVRQRKSIKEVVYSYLRNNPYATFRELREALPSIKPSSISGYHSTWKQTDAPKDYYEKKKALAQAKKANKRQFSKTVKLVENHTKARSAHNEDLIQALKETIEAQKGTIEVMKYQNQILKERQQEIIAEIDTISKKEFDELKNIISVYIKGLRK